MVITHGDAKTDAALVCATHRHGQRIIGVHHADFGILINAQLGGTVLLQTKGISVHMIFSHVEDRRSGSMQAGGRFQLEAGKLENIQFTAFIQQHQSRQTNVTANADVHARRFCHFPHQGGDGAFTVRTGNRDNGSLRFAAEQLDIANNLNARICGSAQGRMRQRHTRAGDNQIGCQQPVIIQTTQVAFNLFRQLVQTRRRDTRIHHARRHATREEKVHAGEPREAQPDDNDFFALVICHD